MEAAAVRAGSQQVAPTSGAGLDRTVEQTRAVVASLDAALAFTRALAGALPLLTQLLARCKPASPRPMSCTADCFPRCTSVKSAVYCHQHTSKLIRRLVKVACGTAESGLLDPVSI